MSHEHVENKKTSAAAELSPAMLEYMERIRRHTETYASSLRDVFDKEGNSENFQEALEDLAAEIAFEDPEYAANVQKLRNPRLSKDEDKRITVEQKAIIGSIKQLITQEAGIPTEEAQTDIEKAQERVRERLQDVDLEEADSDELLRKLGILQESEQGGAVFHYPEELFPESSNLKWNLYIAAVENHIQTGEEVRAKNKEQADLGTADKARKFAHDRITEDVHAILGFNNLPEQQWNFEDTRRLISKMREAKFVGRPSSESKVTSNALARGMGAVGLRVLDKLAQRTKR